jgi:hypothetical protein
MDEHGFWTIIEQLDWNGTDDDEILEPAVNALSNLGPEEIMGFEEILAEKLHALDSEQHARNIGENSYGLSNNHFSPDLFLYVRCYAVAQGKSFYHQALSDPSRMPQCLEFEAILDLARMAYEKSTGSEYTHIPETDYETFANENGW